MNPRARPFTVTFQTVSTRIVTTGRAPMASASASRHPRVAHAPPEIATEGNRQAYGHGPGSRPAGTAEPTPSVTDRHTDFGKPLGSFRHRHPKESMILSGSAGMTIWPPVLAAAVAAAAALVGYWLTYVSKRPASKTEIYAKAVETVEAYKPINNSLTAFVVVRNRVPQ